METRRQVAERRANTILLHIFGRDHDFWQGSSNAPEQACALIADEIENILDNGLTIDAPVHQLFSEDDGKGVWTGMDLLGE